MAYLDLAPAITTIRSRPEDFEFSNNTLHHLSSRHRFRFSSDGDVQVDAACDCSMLRISREQGKAFHAAYREWYATYWRPIEINREFASHFCPPSLWQRLAMRFLKYLLSRPRSTKPASAQVSLLEQSVGLKVCN